MLNLYRINSSMAGPGPIYLSLDNALEKVKEIISWDETHSDVITISLVKMSLDEYDALPEHDGY